MLNIEIQQRNTYRPNRNEAKSVSTLNFIMAMCILAVYFDTNFNMYFANYVCSVGFMDSRPLEWPLKTKAQSFI